jgi:hypothetical protein
MTDRQIRRAAERKARKEARKLAKQTAIPVHQNLQAEPASVSGLAAATHLSDARLLANSQHSTGPRTDQGKPVASQNDLKTALTGRTVLHPTDERARYEQHLSHYFEFWRRNLAAWGLAMEVGRNCARRGISVLSTLQG